MKSAFILLSVLSTGLLAILGIIAFVAAMIHWFRCIFHGDILGFFIFPWIGIISMSIMGAPFLLVTKWAEKQERKC